MILLSSSLNIEHVGRLLLNNNIYKVTELWMPKVASLVAIPAYEYT